MQGLKTPIAQCCGTLNKRNIILLLIKMVYGEVSSEVSTSGAVSLNCWNWKAQPLLGACEGSKGEKTWRLALRNRRRQWTWHCLLEQWKDLSYDSLGNMDADVQFLLNAWSDKIKFWRDKLQIIVWKQTRKKQWQVWQKFLATLFKLTNEFSHCKVIN